MDVKRLTCIRCPIGCQIEARMTESGLSITGNTCKRGEDYAKEEAVAPKRTLTTTVRAVINGEKKTAPVKTKGDIPKEMLFEAMNVINSVELTKTLPLGAVVVENILGTGVNVVLTDTLN